MFGGLTAKRFAGKPLRQPNYKLCDVPKCERDMSKSTVYHVTERDHFEDALAEMLLLCNEVMRRQTVSPRTKGTKAKRTSKPLSLEYMADRLDVDDPLFGFIVRTATGTNETENLQGMLQGFISVTTFTNWQKTFRWDSMHDSAFSYDDEHTAKLLAEGKRVYDKDGSLAAQLESTVRCGDPWNEGIIWPRIAEISLLGALGCGKTLVNLAIEKLESMPPSSKANYDFVVLQATENSIPFYESMGFVRVGCITESNDLMEQRNDDISSNKTNDNGDDSLSKKNANKIGSQQSESCIVSSSVLTYVTAKDKEMPIDIAKKFHVDVWDIVFLNHFMYPDISPRSWLLKGTHVFYPDTITKDNAITNADNQKLPLKNGSAPKWYFCEDNETPKEIAKKFGENCRELLKVNKYRIPDLQMNSKLIERTKIQVSNFDIHPDQHTPYCHWTFPDDKFEDNEPSYIMARKLNRRRNLVKKNVTPISSIPLTIKKYAPPTNSSSNTVMTSKHENIRPQNFVKTKSKKRKRHPAEPIPPKRPITAYFQFMNKMRQTIKTSNQLEVAKIVSEKWKALAEVDKIKYIELSNKARSEYKIAVQKYRYEMEEFNKKHPELVRECEISSALTPTKKLRNGGGQNLFNKVVKLNKDGIEGVGTEYKYYYVLTFLPDLQWCHLAPMKKVGVYGNDKPKSQGRPMWMLVNEDEGKEIDVTSTYCEVVKSRATKGCPDADREQWDILDSEAPLAPIFTSRAKTGLDDKDHPPLPSRPEVTNYPDISTTPKEMLIENKEKQSFHLISLSPNFHASSINPSTTELSNTSVSDLDVNIIPSKSEIFLTPKVNLAKKEVDFNLTKSLQEKD